MEAIIEKGIIYPRMRSDCQWNCRITLNYCRERNGEKRGGFLRLRCKQFTQLQWRWKCSLRFDGGVWRLWSADKIVAESRRAKRNLSKKKKKKKVCLIQQSDLLCVAAQPEMRDRAPTLIMCSQRAGALSGTTPHRAMRVYGEGHNWLGDHQNVEIMMWTLKDCTTSASHLHPESFFRIVAWEKIEATTCTTYCLTSAKHFHL